MSLRQDLPPFAALHRPRAFQAELPAGALEKWSRAPLAADDDEDDATITIFDQIGVDWWTGEGVTAKRVSAALRKIGNRDVTVRINSPGGDVFEGTAIYQALRKHKARVTVEIMGVAASAASIIAMAGDEISMGLGTWMMIHNTWSIGIGNRDDLRDLADTLEAFDNGLLDIYVARTGGDRASITEMMVSETWLTPTNAVEQGFADVVDDDLSIETDESDGDNSKARAALAKRTVENALAKENFTRAERSELISELLAGAGAPRDASASNAARDAGDEDGETAKALAALLETLTT